jgi:hypothetical protein
LNLDLPRPEEEEPIWDEGDEDYSESDVSSGADDDDDERSSDETEGSDLSDSSHPTDLSGDETWDDTFQPLLMEDGETPEEYMEREYRCQQTMEEIEALEGYMALVMDYIKELKRYPLPHRHIEEVPRNLKGLMECAKRNLALRNATTSKPTWGPARRGNMFID